MTPQTALENLKVQLQVKRQAVWLGVNRRKKTPDDPTLRDWRGRMQGLDIAIGLVDRELARSARFSPSETKSPKPEETIDSTVSSSEFSRSSPELRATPSKTTAA